MTPEPEAADTAERDAAADRIVPRTRAGDALTELVLPAFELNGEFLAAAETRTRPSG
jgi:hypothetical protein